jgi:hypothetical protein
MTMDTPEWLAGAWVRTARSIADGPPTECSEVVWLQVGPWFADVRVPRPGRLEPDAFDAAHAFSGRLACLEESADRLRVAWDHDLDSEVHEGDPDTAWLVVRDGVLIESGDGYVEWWEPPEFTPEHPDVVLAWPSPDTAAPRARIVCTHGLAVTVWSDVPAGGAWCSAGSGWEPQGVVGTVPPDLQIGAVLRAAVAGHPLPEPWTQVV